MNTIKTSNPKLIWDIRRTGKPHQVQITGNTTLVKIFDKYGSVETKVIFSDNEISFSTLGFIRSVKADFNKSNVDLPKVDPSQIYYFFCSDSLVDGTYEDVIEVDINKAYWELAFRNKIISQDIYEKGLKVDKMDRLISFGSLATKRNIYNYNENSGLYDYIGQEFSESGRNAFFYVCAQLGDIMNSAMQEIGANFLFYWVDAFFIKSCDLMKLAEIIHGNDLGFKVKKCSPMTVKSEDSGKRIICNKGEGGEKSFFLPSGRKAKKTAGEVMKIVNNLLGNR